MKLILTILIIIIVVPNLFGQNKLCEECSRSSLGGFEYYQSSGGYSLGSAVGGLSAAPLNSSDGQYILVSGYMPICVLPIASIGKGDTVCSDEQAEFTASGYLTESAKWYVNNSLIQNQSYSYIPTIQNTKDANGYSEAVKVELTKGKYIVESETAYYRENPSIDLKVVFPKKICKNNTVEISFEDRILNSFESINWDNTTGITFPDQQDKSKAFLILDSGSQTYSITFINKFGCDTTISVDVESIAPSAKIRVNSLQNLRPADVKKTEPKEIPIVFDSAGNFNFGCAPDSAIITLSVRSSMFLPNENSTKSKITYDKSAGYTDQREIRIEAKVPSSVQAGTELAILEGWVLLGDVVETPIEIKSIDWKGANISDNTVNTSPIGGIISIDCCGDNTAIRLINKSGNASIIKVSPMPSEGNEIRIEVLSESEEVQTMDLMIFNSIGENLGALYSGNISNGLNYIKATLPEGILSGIYYISIAGQGSTYPLIIAR